MFGSLSNTNTLRLGADLIAPANRCLHRLMPTGEERIGNIMNGMESPANGKEADLYG